MEISHGDWPDPPPPPTEDGRGCGLGRFDLLVAMVARFRLVPGMEWVGQCACEWGVSFRPHTYACAYGCGITALGEGSHLHQARNERQEGQAKKVFQVHSSLALAACAADEAPLR